MNQECRIINFPMTEEMKNRLQENQNNDNAIVVIDYNSEEFFGNYSNKDLTPVFAYGETPVLDYTRDVLLFDEEFSTKIRRLGLYRMTKRLFNDMQKDLKKIKVNNEFTKQGYNFHAVFDQSGFDYFAEEDEWFCLASVSIPEIFLDDHNQIIMPKEDFLQLTKEIKILQNKITQRMNQFKRDVEELIELKKNNSKNKNIKNIVLNIDVA